MSEVFVSYARSTARQAQFVAELLRSMGHDVWLDDLLPAHRSYSEVIEDRLRAAKAVVVLWSKDAAKSQWVRAEADVAREAGTLVQLRIDDVTLPLPFNQIQCADLVGWSGNVEAPGWRTVSASIADLLGQDHRPDVSRVDQFPPLPSKPSIAVMPFENLTGDEEQDYFVDGMVVEIVAALTRIKSIFVTASSSSLSFKGKSITDLEASRSLGVRYLLEGSVRRSSGRVRIAVQLIDAAEGVQIWATRFDDTLDDVFALQDAVALSVAGVIEPAVQRAEIRKTLSRPTNNMGSYDLYLRAYALYQTFAKAETTEALDLLDRAIALDPNFAPALALAAYCHADIYRTAWATDTARHQSEGIRLAQRALQAAGDDAEVLSRAASALVLLGEDFATATALIDRSIALNPGSSYAWYMSGMLRTAAGESETAFEHFETAMRLDPLSPMRPVQLTGMGAARFEQRRFDDAIALLKEAAQHRAALPTNYALLAACYGHLGLAQPAHDALTRLKAFTTADIQGVSVWAFRDPEHLRLFLEGYALAEAQSAALSSSPA